MDEGIAMRAVTIGVSVFIAIATMTAVMTYYNTAKQVVLSIGAGTDVSGLYTKSIESTLLKHTASGSDVKNLLNYFYNSKAANINISMDLFTNGNTPVTKRVAYSNINNAGDAIFNSVVKYIMPNQKFSITYSYDDYGILVVAVNSK